MRREEIEQALKSPDHFVWLQGWYYAMCDGEWEHDGGVSIDTLDNPGWFVEINLFETSLETLPFEKYGIERSPNDWIDCQVKENKFVGTGGPMNLSELVSVFREWASSSLEIKPWRSFVVSDMQLEDIEPRDIDSNAWKSTEDKS